MKEIYWWIGWKFMDAARWFFRRSPGGCCVYCGRKVGMNSVVWAEGLTCWPCHDVHYPMWSVQQDLRRERGKAEGEKK